MRPFATIFLAVLVCAVFSISSARGAEPDYTGARLEDLKEQVAKAPNKTLITMLLASSEGFAPNVTIAVQDYAKPMADYIALSYQQFDDMYVDGVWAKQFFRRTGEVAFRIEITGFLKVLPGKKVHVYSRAFQKDGKMYVATAVALESQWAKHGKKLKQQVESFKGE